MLELLPVRAPGNAPFVLAMDTALDRCIAPCIRGTAIWEPAETLLVSRVVRSGMHVVDAGAHVGYYSVLLSRRVGADGSVHAFEPEPENYRLLAANLLLNDCRNAQAHRVALTDQAGRAQLSLAEQNLGDHRLHAVAGRRAVDVNTITLDAARAGAHVDFIKIDTQGSEPRLFAGMARTLAANRAHLALLMEFAPGLLEQAGTTVAAFAATLEREDARVFTMGLRGSELVLRRQAPLAQGLSRLADALAQKNEVDASTDVFVVFGDEAEALWLARYRGSA